MKFRVFSLALSFAASLLLAGCGGTGGGIIQPPPPPPKPSVTLSANPTSATLPSGQTTMQVKLTWSSTNTSGTNPCTASAAPSVTGWSGAMAASGSANVNLAAGNFSFSMQCTGSGGSGSGGPVAVTVNTGTQGGAITTVFAKATTSANSNITSIPNNLISLDQAGLSFTMTWNCTGCQAGDVFNSLVTIGSPLQITLTQSTTAAQSVALLPIGGSNVPGLAKEWIDRPSDGTTSNANYYLYALDEQFAVQDTSASGSGEVYFLDPAQGAQQNGYIRAYTASGVPDPSFGSSGSAHVGVKNGIAFDDKTGRIYVTFASGGNAGVQAIDPKTGQIDSAHSVAVPTNLNAATAVSANGGLVCWVQPGDNAAYCIDATQLNPTAIALPTPGNQPAAVAVIDGSHAAIYSRGDRQVRWYSVSGGSATLQNPSNPVTLANFTAYDSTYATNYPFTNGWYMAMVGSKIAVMGQVVNQNGTVSQSLAVLSDGTMSLDGYATLPAGTYRIAPDAGNQAFVAEYTVIFNAPTNTPPPVGHFVRVDANTRQVGQPLNSTSNLVPGVGFIVLQNTDIALFLGTQVDVQQNN